MRSWLSRILLGDVYRRDERAALRGEHGLSTARCSTTNRNALTFSTAMLRIACSFGSRPTLRWRVRHVSSHAARCALEFVTVCARSFLSDDREPSQHVMFRALNASRCTGNVCRTNVTLARAAPRRTTMLANVWSPLRSSSFLCVARHSRENSDESRHEHRRDLSNRAKRSRLCACTGSFLLVRSRCYAPASAKPAPTTSQDLMLVRPQRLSG